MHLTVLVENTAPTYGTENSYVAEPGLSFYLEDGDEKILFDTGRTDVVIRNAEMMGIDLSAVTKLVLSHGHDDHAGGIPHLPPMNAELIAHPKALLPKQEHGRNSGCPLSENELALRFQMVPSSTPQKISPHLTFLGEIPELNDFEPRKAFGTYEENGELVPDYVFDDSALVYETEDAIYVITGCSHSGICNIVAYAQNLFGKRVAGIIGGFHLRYPDERVEKTIQFLKSLGDVELRPCHCTSFAVRAAMHQEIPVIETAVGTKIDW